MAATIFEDGWWMCGHLRGKQRKLCETIHSPELSEFIGEGRCPESRAVDDPYTDSYWSHRKTEVDVVIEQWMIQEYGSLENRERVISSRKRAAVANKSN